MKQQHLHIARRWLGRWSWRQWLAGVGGGLLGLIILIQLLYPSDRLLPGVKIEGQTYSAWTKADVARDLNGRYLAQRMPLYFGESKSAYRKPGPAEIGLKVNNEARLAAANYPWWLRLVPTSVLWASGMLPVREADYQVDAGQLAAYVNKELGQSCDVAPKNANLTYANNDLKVVKAEAGGTCKVEDVRKQLSAAKPKLDQLVSVRVPMKASAPKISDAQAKQLAQQISVRVGQGVPVEVGSQKITIERASLLGWLDFKATDDKLEMSISSERSKDFIDNKLAPKLAKAAGVSRVTTMDFAEVSRVDGPSGQALDSIKTLAALQTYLQGEGETVKAVARTVVPRVEYTRQYSPTDTGLSALLAQYAQAHPGTFGVALAELGGSKRRAAYQDDRQFRTASTYKLYVAYGALKRVEAGVWQWGDQIQGGRNLEKCLDDMIVKSDNPCGEVLLSKLGYQALTNELKSLGLTGTTFTQEFPKTTARDLTTFMGSLESGQLLSGDSRNRLLGLLKRNIYRQGIPAGTSATVANKVGFLDAFLHDAAIVYGPSGPMVLSIMTEGSSWATIADLTKQIEALRAK